MFRYDHISITVPAGDLTQEVWSFWFDDRDTLVLDSYRFQERKTKRHGWKSQSVWDRINYNRTTNIERPAIPLWVQAQAKADFIAQFSAGLKVEA
jgi:hypothetical protein